uniref:Uncharacterized protein n=1 Tax=Utricularia reniformis TaxID=192314 RepID=A0A1Y0B1U7_9LAMI|nr:hypothetical protein AEK19_MT1146 [Utricularia reniformis]ART31361.1 hypothetical protein AEK19_MT1146 [Utricularia reniformis]
MSLNRAPFTINQLEICCSKDIRGVHSKGDSGRKVGH